MHLANPSTLPPPPSLHPHLLGNQGEIVAPRRVNGYLLQWQETIPNLKQNETDTLSPTDHTPNHTHSYSNVNGGLLTAALPKLRSMGGLLGFPDVC